MSKVKSRISKLICEVYNGIIFGRKENYIVNHEEKYKPTQIECSKCKKTYFHQASLRKHFEICKGNSENTYCKVCNKEYANQKSMTKHNIRYHSSLKYQCDICGLKLPSKKLQTKHRKDTHLVEYICKDCGKVFSNKGNLNVHHMTKHDPHYVPPTKNNFICDICGKEITSRTSFAAHLRIHRNEKPFVCSVCGKAFSSRPVFNVHKRTHTNEKPFGCKVCGKNFTQKSTLTIHMRLHTGEKPYNCSICPKKFISRTALNSHFKTHSIQS